MTHSPAPWRIVYNDIIYDANDDTVVEYYRLAKYPADAALIAAAPEMLAMLKELSRYDDEMYKVDSYYAMNADLRYSLNELIAKAEGNVPTQTETK